MLISLLYFTTVRPFRPATPTSRETNWGATSQVQPKTGTNFHLPLLLPRGDCQRRLINLITHTHVRRPKSEWSLHSGLKTSNTPSKQASKQTRSSESDRKWPPHDLALWGHIRNKIVVEPQQQCCRVSFPLPNVAEPRSIRLRWTFCDKVIAIANFTRADDKLQPPNERKSHCPGAAFRTAPD